MQTTSSNGRAEKRTDGLGAQVLGWLRKPAQVEMVDPMSWYVVLDAEYHGPISRETLIEVLAEHDHDEDAPIWSASHAEEWTTMGEVPGLAAAVAVARARRAGHEQVTHPAELPAFAISQSDSRSDDSDSAPMLPSHSGEVDIGAALRAMIATNIPMRAERLASVATPRAMPPKNFVERSVAARVQQRLPIAPAVQPSLPVERSRTWIAAGMGLGGLGIAALMTPFIIAASRPLPTPPSDTTAQTPFIQIVAPPAPPAGIAAPTAMIAAPSVTPAAAPVVAAAPPAVAAMPMPDADRSNASASNRSTASEPRRHRGEPAARVAAPVAAAPSSPVTQSPDAVAEAPVVAEAHRVAEAPRAPRSLEELLAAAAPESAHAAPPPQRAEPAGPRVVPTDAEVVHALDAVRASVLACTPVHNVAALRITFRGGSGRVTVVYVDGPFAGTPAGSCIATAVRAARVEPFSQTSFSYSYPYRL